MKNALVSAFRDARVVAISVLVSSLVLSGGVLTAQLSAFHAPAAAWGPNRVFTGEYALGGGASALDVDDIKLTKKMKYPIKGFSRFQVIRRGAPFTANCPAVGQVVPKGFICIYERYSTGSSSSIQVADPSSVGGFGTTKTRMLLLQFGGNSTFSFGSYAIRTGDATTAVARKGDTRRVGR